MNNYDLIIVGAGPAGIFTALELLRKSSKTTGPRICLIEKGKPVDVYKRQGSIECQIALQEQAVCFAFLGNQGKSMLDRFVGIVEVHQVVAEIHTPCRTGTHAENGFQQLCTSGAHQAIQTKNFALAHIKADILQIRRIFGGQMLDGQDRIRCV